MNFSNKKNKNPKNLLPFCLLKFSRAQERLSKLDKIISMKSWWTLRTLQSSLLSHKLLFGNVNSKLYLKKQSLKRISSLPMLPSSINPKLAFNYLQMEISKRKWFLYFANTWKPLNLSWKIKIPHQIIQLTHKM